MRTFASLLCAIMLGVMITVPVFQDVPVWWWVAAGLAFILAFALARWEEY